MQNEVISIKTITTENSGKLSFFEAERNIPFAIKRVYYIHGVANGVRRGGHAHKELWQFLFCPYGKIRILLDDGSEKSEVVLDGLPKGLIVGPGIWHDMIWLKEDSILCVAASEYYDEADYIRDYDDFIKFVRANIYDNL